MGAWNLWSEQPFGTGPAEDVKLDLECRQTSLDVTPHQGETKKALSGHSSYSNRSFLSRKSINLDKETVVGCTYSLRLSFRFPISDFWKVLEHTELLSVSLEHSAAASSIGFMLFWRIFSANIFLDMQAVDN